MNYTSAVFAAAVTIYYWWQNIKGIEESSGKALRVMQITTVMVVILLLWGVFSVMVRGAHLPPPPMPSNLKFSDDALGFLKGTRLVPLFGLFGILMAFGHSVLAMSGEESLAQVNREIEHPKLKNLKRAAIVIAIYSLIFTGGATLLASMLIPAWERTHIYQDNLIAGLAMYMVGPLFWRIAFRIFVVLVGFLILSGAINTSMIGSTGVLMRVAEDGVLTDWFRKPHPRFGTSYRIVNLVFILQMFTIIASRGNVITLGEAYAFGVIWSFTFNSLAMLVLRWKYHGERGWKVPPNIRIGKIEIPIGLLSVFLVLLSTAIVNLFTKSVATVSGIVFAAGFFIIFYRLRAAEPAQARADRAADEGSLPARAPGHGQPRVGGHPPRRRDGDHARRRQSPGAEVDALPHQHRGAGRGGHQRAHDGRGRPGVSERRGPELQRARADALHQGRLGCRELWQEGLAAGGSRRRCLRRAGAGRKLAGGGLGGFRSFNPMTAEDQAFHMGQAWEALPEPKRQFNFYVVAPSGEVKVFYIGPHAPALSPDDVQLVHRLWLNMRRDPSVPGSASQRHHHLCPDPPGRPVRPREAGDSARSAQLSRGRSACRRASRRPEQFRRPASPASAHIASASAQDIRHHLVPIH